MKRRNYLIVCISVVTFFCDPMLALAEQNFLQDSQALVTAAYKRVVAENPVDANNVLARLQDLRPVDVPAIQGAMLFVSFSMPDESLRAWIAQATHLQIPVIIRGLYQDSLLKTQQKVATLLIDDQGGIAIDPVLFKKFAVEQVPTLVIARDENSVDKVAGNVSLATLLDMIVSQGEYGNAIARELLDRLKQ